MVGLHAHLPQTKKSHSVFFVVSTGTTAQEDVEWKDRGRQYLPAVDTSQPLSTPFINLTLQTGSAEDMQTGQLPWISH